MDPSGELNDLSPSQRVEYVLSQWKQGVGVSTLSAQYRIPRSTIYYWIVRYKAQRTYQRIKLVPGRIQRKVTEAVKSAVLAKHFEYPKLGCWRLSLFAYENQSLSPTTIWRILTEAKSPKLPPQLLYVLRRYHQIWFLDHMHLRTLPNGQKVYGLIVLDGLSRVLLSDEIVLSKSAKTAVVILIKAFARWGLPEEILSDNAGAFTSLLYTLVMAALRVKVRYTAPGSPWENPFAESMIKTLRAYFYPHVQRQKSVAGIQRVYTETTDYYNRRQHWAFRKDAINTPLGKLGTAKGELFPQNFELSLIQTSRGDTRTVSRHGRIAFKRYSLFVRTELKHDKVEIRQCFDSLVVTYEDGAVVSYKCTTEQGEMVQVENAPLFHDHPQISDSPQLELFDLSNYQLRYVTKRPAYQSKRFKRDAIQLALSRTSLNQKTQNQM